jgi:hypothetical protein
MSTSKLVRRGNTQRRIQVEIAHFSSTVLILSADTPPNSPFHPISFPGLDHHNNPFSPINHPLLQPIPNQHDPPLPSASLALKLRHPQLSTTHRRRVFASTYRTPQSAHMTMRRFLRVNFYSPLHDRWKSGFLVRWRGVSRDAWVRCCIAWVGGACLSGR